ncbi:hypothetical protein Mterra_03911 [Calidithermus terrae]|uniref:Uncharacterized protein n=1 Tax=Calidithermus terrae TaxID=1408545 RepID=A0A399DX33_9DEIN|nr:hypothetical protein Mterra_03911 [Calidithermus terrae]
MGAVEGGVGVVEPDLELGVGAQDALDLGEEGLDLGVIDGAGGIDGEVDPQLLALQGLEVEAAAQEAAVEALEVGGGGGEEAPQQGAPVEAGRAGGAEQALEPGRGVALVHAAGQGGGLLVGAGPVGLELALPRLAQRVLAQALSARAPAVAGVAVALPLLALGVGGGGLEQVQAGQLVGVAVLEQQGVDLLHAVALEGRVEERALGQLEAVVAQDAVDHDVGGDVPQAGVAARAPGDVEVGGVEHLVQQHPLELALGELAHEGGVVEHVTPVGGGGGDLAGGAEAGEEGQGGEEGRAAADAQQRGREAALEGLGGRGLLHGWASRSRRASWAAARTARLPSKAARWRSTSSGAAGLRARA